MENRTNRFFKKLLKSRMFWRYFLLFLLCSIVFDFFTAYVLAWKGITSGKWSTALLIFAGITVLLRVMGNLLKKPQNVWFKKWGRVGFFGTIVWTFYQYGFFQGMTFIALLILVTRLLQFLLKRLKVPSLLPGGF